MSASWPAACLCLAGIYKGRRGHWTCSSHRGLHYQLRSLSARDPPSRQSNSWSNRYHAATLSLWTHPSVCNSPHSDTSSQTACSWRWSARGNPALFGSTLSTYSKHYHFNKESCYWDLMMMVLQVKFRVGDRFMLVLQDILNVLSLHTHKRQMQIIKHRKLCQDLSILTIVLCLHYTC